VSAPVINLRLSFVEFLVLVPNRVARLIALLSSLFSRPHLVDFPYFWRNNPLTSMRVYHSFNISSKTTLVDEKLKPRSPGIGFRFARNRFFSSRLKTLTSHTYTEDLILRRTIQREFSVVNKVSKPNSNLSKTLFLYIDGLSPQLIRPETGVTSFMPYLHSVISSGTFFPKFFSNAEWTLPNLGSLMYGVLPSQHGLYRSGADYKFDYIIPKYQNIFQYLESLGVVTRVFSSVPYFNPNFGFHIGTKLFAYMKNRPAEFLIQHFFEAKKHQTSFRSPNSIDALLLMDVHHQLSPNRITIEDDFPGLHYLSASTGLNIADTKNLISRAKTLDNTLERFLDSRFMQDYSQIVVVSDHGSARLRKDPKLCLDNPRINTTLAIIGEISPVLDPTKLYSPVHMPGILSTMNGIRPLPEFWSVDDNVVITQSIHRGQPYRLRIFDGIFSASFTSNLIWENRKDFKSELIDFLEVENAHFGHSKGFSSFRRDSSFETF